MRKSEREARGKDQQRDRRDEKKRAKDLPPDKRKGRDVKGGAGRLKF